MLNRIRELHSSIYFVGLSLMIISLPTSRFALSVAQFVLVGNWLLEGKFKKKFTALITNIPALILISLYLLHVAGLIYTSDINYALKDLRIKLPLLAIPIIFVTTQPLNNKQFNFLFLLYIGAVIVASLISFGILLFSDFNDLREISPFISHIRLSLNICLAIFFSGYFAFGQNIFFKSFRSAFIFAIGWLTAFLFLSQSGTGIYIVFLTSLIMVLYGLFKIRNKRYKTIMVTVFFAFSLSVGLYIFITIRNYLVTDKSELQNLAAFTVKGNPYSHDTLNSFIENGSYIGIYVCDSELREAWNKRSAFDYDGKDEKGNDIKATMIRYLNSKGLKKDSEGVAALNDSDIRNIEQSWANYYYSRKISLKAGIYNLLWEYQMMKHGANPGGLSLGQRVEYWKAASGIISEYFWTGVGTGDMDEAFKLQYQKMKSRLAPEFQHRSHNQFLAIFTAFGVIGLLWFIFTLLYPPIALKKISDFRFLTFFIIIALSMLVEDTLETQQGVTLYAFFGSLLLFVHKE